MALYGGLRTTNAVFAEDEEGLPKGWPSLAIDRGFAKGANVVTVTPVSGMTNVSTTQTWGTKESNDATLNIIAKYMNSPNQNVWTATGDPSLWTSPNRSAGIVLIARDFAASLASVSGYSKMDVRTFLWNNSKLPWSDAVATGLSESSAALGLPKGQDMPLTSNPKQITFVVTGGTKVGMPIGCSKVGATGRW